MCLALVASTLASRSASASVCTAVEVCPASASACSIAGTKDVGDGCELDFGSRNVVLAGTLQSAVAGGSFTVRAGTLTLSAGRIRSTGPSGAAGGNVTVQVAGALVLSGAGPTLDVSGAANGGVLSVTAGSIDVRNGSVAADGTGSGACGGAIFLRATGGPLALAAPVHATGNPFCAGGLLDLSGSSVTIASTLNVAGGDLPGGIGLTANAGDVTVTSAGLLKASGEQIELGDGGDGGPITIVAESGNVSIQGAISTEGATPEGAGGAVGIVAGGRVDLAAPIAAQGNGGGSDGGSVEIDAGGDVAITANVRVGGGSDAAGGEVDVRADGEISVASGRLVQASGGSYGGGSITFRDASRVDVAGTLEARGAGGNGGFVTLQTCRANVSGTLDTGSGGGGLSGANAIIAGIVTVTGTGRLHATPCNPMVSGGCNGITLTAGVPAFDPLALAIPAPLVTIDPTLAACCGNVTIELGESCDDGNALGCDGCSNLCQLEATPVCPSDGNECTQDCSPTAGCTYAPRIGHSCTDDGNACTTGTCLRLSGGELCLALDDACVGNCTAQADGTPCSDGSACTTGSCRSGACEPTPVPCGDGDRCTGADYCLASIGCRSGAPPVGEPMCAPGDGLDAFVCYEARSDRAGPPFAQVLGVPVEDRFGSARADLRKHDGLCLPASLAGADPTAPAHPDKLGGHLVRLRDTVSTGASRTAVAVQSTLGTVRLDLKKIDGALLPAALDATAPPGPPVPPDPDRFACYKVASTSGDAKFAPLFGVAIEDAFGPLTIDVARPARLCSPLDVNGADPTAPGHAGQLLCFQIRTSQGMARFVKRTGLWLGSEIGSGKLDVSSLEELCVPATILP